MSEPLLKIGNHHVPASGDPPIVDDAKADQYIGYFENRFGEQWVFTRDRLAAQRYCAAATSVGRRRSLSPMAPLEN